ncbi:MAG: sodium:solute symporter family protein [Bdellovibrionales bacterium]|nr:sodium:solute symporter family protein [Oligoflexia bacterium]
MNRIHTTALIVFLFFFLLVTVLGFAASRWNSSDSKTVEKNLDEWGLGGRQFGAWVTWFLVGGDFYTAYTVIAVPALVYAVGAYGFFALPYTILVYPFIYLVMPKLWTAAQAGGCVTAGDYVYVRYSNRRLEYAVAITGLIATMPYIALQLVGMEVVLKAMGLQGELPLILAFLILAFYTYSSGLRAPALIAFVKDIMIYIVVIAAVILIPLKLGGYASIFAAAKIAFDHKSGATGTLLQAGQMLPFATLALGSALAAFMYPHTMTGVLAAKNADVVRKNAIFLPAYTVLLGMIALLGFMAIAAGVTPQNATEVVPLLFDRIFPEWFSGFAFAAIAIGALVPAAVMSIGASNLFTRNLWKPLIKPAITPEGEAKVAKIVSLVVKLGALVCIVFLPTKFAIDLQLLGGVWMLQIFPAVVFGLFMKKLHTGGLFWGWLAGILLGTFLAFSSGTLKPVYGIPLAGEIYTVYIGLIALALNCFIALGTSGFMRRSYKGL